jgi:hypothetical protein
MRYLGEGETMAGIGEIAQAPDGSLYEWVEGVDGLGNAVGFWKKLRKVVSSAARYYPPFAALRAARPFLRRALPIARRFAPFVPGFGPAAAAALTAASPLLQKAGVAGYGLGELYEASDGTVYQMQGVSEDDLNGYLAEDELQGFAADDELQGIDEDPDLSGIDADDEIQGLSEDDELRGIDEEQELQGLAEEDELRGIDADEELQGVGADEDLSEFSESDDLQGLDQGYIREDGFKGVDAYVPQQPPATRWFAEPNQPPPLWKALW